jgi:hypothetical protein
MQNNILTTEELFKQAAIYKGTEFRHLDGETPPLATYQVDEHTLEVLQEGGVRHDYDPLLNLWYKDNVSQRPYAGNRWQLPADDPKLELKLIFDMHPNGIALVPAAEGGFISPGRGQRDALGWMFRMIAKLHWNDAPPLIREIAGSQEPYVISWDELGLKGVRLLVDLFEEFAGCTFDPEKVKALMQCPSVNPFSPNPSPDLLSLNRYSREHRWVVQPAQKDIFVSWRSQLEAFSQAISIRQWQN